MSIQTKKQKLKERRHKNEIRHRFAIFATVFAILAALSLSIGTFAAGYKYAETSHGGAQSPAYAAIIAAIPYLAAFLVLLIAFCICFYKSKRRAS